MKRNTPRFIWIFLLTASLTVGAQGRGTPLESAESPKLRTGMEGLNAGLLKDIDASADMYEYVGDNIIARGHVVVKAGAMQLTADRAVININSQDIEASGNVTFSRKVSETRPVDFEEYQDLRDDPSKKIEILGYATAPNGRKKIKVRITTMGAYMKADRVAGNIVNGVLQFRNFALKTGPLYSAAAYAERAPNGKITVENARLTTCEYVMDDHDHYALTASKAVLSPRHYNSGVRNYNFDHGEHSALLYNAMLRVWDVPVLWLPVLYKPLESDSFGIDLAFGKTSDWGYWIRTSKGFNLVDENNVSVNAAAHVDYYSERGFGSGATVNLSTLGSKTEFFGYGIHDRDPYKSWDTSDNDVADWYKSRTRLNIPSDRYDIKLTNLTHITPRLDFRGQFELLSDVNFLQDYFDSRYRENVQPPTYASLEYQFERATAAVLTTPRVNSFDTTMQRLPEGILNFPRQELFGGIYYQSETSGGYYSMAWRDFDRPSRYGSLRDYSSGRFDTLHMFYYPMMLDFVNLIPRAGGRFTAYSTVADNSISDEDLMNMFRADSVDDGLALDWPFKNFEQSHSAKFRLTGEFGVEANTKIYRSWQDVRSAFWNLDGLRHVFVPYVNYTYIPKSNLDPDEILYFDDNDRLDEQNFVRLGAVNRLQTRTGNYGSEQIYQWASIETYWDFHFKRNDQYNHVGDFGTRFSFTPFENLSLTSDLLWDLGQNNEHDSEAVRARGRQAGRVGLSKLKYLDLWNTTLQYKIAKDWKVSASYVYSDTYWKRPTYSMGSMIDNLNATTTTLNASYPRSQWFNFGLDFPTYIDPKLKAKIYFSYDVDGALMDDMGIRLTRNFHCWFASLEMGRHTTRDGEGDKTDSFYVGLYAGLSAMPQVALSLRGGD